MSGVYSTPYANLGPICGDARSTCTATAPTPATSLSETSVSHTFTLLSTILKWAVRSRYISHNPCADVDRPKREESEMRVWGADQLRAFLAVEDRLMPLFRVLAMCGLRRSEALAMQWRDVDLDAATISVRRARVRVRGEMIDRPTPKTKRGQRSIDLDPATVAVLRKWRTDQKAERLAWGPAWTDTGYIFTDESGLPLTPHVIDRRFVRLTRTAGLPEIRLHDLRHTHATLLLSNGVPVHIAAARLGHKAEVMLATYAHVLPQQQAEAAAAVAGLVDGVRG